MSSSDAPSFHPGHTTSVMVPEGGHQLSQTISHSSASSSTSISPFLSSYSTSASASSYGDLNSPDFPNQAITTPISPLFIKDPSIGTSYPGGSCEAGGSGMMTARASSETFHHICLPEPSLPELEPPENFSVVQAGRIYRSGWPEEENLPFLESLHLKTIVSLVFEEYPETHIKLCNDNKINRLVFGIHGHKVPQGNIPVEAIASALAIILDRRNHPVLIHCNGGKHRTGCVVGCLRRLEDWSEQDIMMEYRRFSEPKARPADEKLISSFIFSDVWNTLRERQGESLEWYPEWSSLKKMKDVERERYASSSAGGSPCGSEQGETPSGKAKEVELPVVIEGKEVKAATATNGA